MRFLLRLLGDIYLVLGEFFVIWNTVGSFLEGMVIEWRFLFIRSCFFIGRLIVRVDYVFLVVVVEII